ncbi:MAG: two-component regulator propeller domain-containing protein [Gracilimonas sp.]
MMRNQEFFKILTAAIFLLAGTNNSIQAQHPGPIDFWHLTPQQGLSQSTGKAILQDHKGYMWIGTQDGLNKYNGYEITVYKNDQGDSSSLGYDDIATLYEDSQNNLWVGTLGGGLNLYNREMDNFTRIKVNEEFPGIGLTDNTVFSIMEDRSGNLWIGTNNGLNIRMKGEDEYRHLYSVPNDPTTISNDYIEKVFQDSRGTIWIGSLHGLDTYNKETDAFFRYTEELGDIHIQEIYETDDGILWFATAERGLLQYNYADDSFVFHSHDPNDQDSIADNSIFAILEDSRGVLWIGTENRGLDVLDRENGVFHHYTQNTSNPTSLNNNAVYSLYENDDHLIWAGTFAGGINILDRKIQKFENYRHNPHQENSLGANSVLSFFEDSNGNMWVGTDGGEGGGLNLFDRNNGSFIALSHDPRNPNTIPSNVILDILEDNEGNIWLGTYNGGVSSFNYRDNTFRHFKHNPNTETGLSQNHVFALLLDNNNNIWAGTNGEGIDILGPDRREFRRFGDDTVRVLGGELNISHIRSFYEDVNGNIWIGTYGSGVVKYCPETEKFESYTIDNSDINNSVIIAIYEDSNGYFWFGTKGGGLNKFDPENKVFTLYTLNHGLPSDVINGILEDEKGNLWLSTHDGIAKFNPETETSINYGLDNGLQSREFNPGAYYKDRDGYFYFGGINGFNRFHPDSIKADSSVHPLVLTNFEIFNQPVAPGENSPLKKHISEAEEIILSHKESVLTFEYAALNFNETKGNTYAYMLDGFDQDWNYVDKRRSATYTNLDAGDYTFRVKAANNDNYWSEEATVKIIITPPFWETAWFYLLSGGLILLIGFSGYRYRVRNIREQNRQLEEEVKNRTSELNQRNLELKETLEDLKATREELIEKAHKAGMADIATGVLHNVGNILNSVNTSSALIDDTLKKSKLEGLEKANKLLRENIHDLDTFITKNDKGKKLLEYYLKLEEPLKNEKDQIIKLSKRLSNKIKLINEVISAQQSYATSTTNSGTYKLSEIVDDSLVLNSGSSERHKIKIEKNYESESLVHCQHTKLVHVLVNIFKNAKEAMADNDESKEKIIRIDIREDETHVYLSIRDSGHGIPKENLAKVFNQGFTTKDKGHGFGLHSSANYINDMDAEIFADSDGDGKGAVFILKFKKAEIMPETAQ